jgi:colanic acid biosynthesis protein WcaH
MPIAWVDIAIVSLGAVLLVQRMDAPAKGQWWVPGGRVLKGEMMKDTARRKAREEVGLACHVGPIIHTAETIFPDGPGGIPVHSINSCFFLYPVEPQISLKLDDHHEAYRWVTAIPAGLHPYVERCLMGAGLEKSPG